MLRFKSRNGTVLPLARKSVEKTDKMLKFPLHFDVRIAESQKFPLGVVILSLWLWTRSWIDPHKYLRQSIQEWTKYNLWETAFKKFEGVRPALSRPYHFNFFKGYLPQIWHLVHSWILCLSHLSIRKNEVQNMLWCSIRGLHNICWRIIFRDGY